MHVFFHGVSYRKKEPKNVLDILVQVLVLKNGQEIGFRWAGMVTGQDLFF